MFALIIHGSKYQVLTLQVNDAVIHNTFICKRGRLPSCELHFLTTEQIYLKTGRQMFCHQIITPLIYTVNIYKTRLQYIHFTFCLIVTGLAVSELQFQEEYVKMNKRDALHVSKQECL